MIVVSDTSPITTLLQIGQSDLLHLLEAKEAGFISSVRNVIEELETKTTFHLSAAMKTRTLQTAGEL
jgi:predicted nucleic acid-binding protein